MSRLPLEGIRVADFGQVVVVPYATEFLAWMGAEVIHVETETRMTSRQTPPFWEAVRGVNRSGMYNFINTTKRSLTINLKEPAGVEVAKRLIATSDIMTENYTTGTMKDLGLDYETVCEVRPDLIYLSVGAFGRIGPMRDLKGYHSINNAFSGVADVTGYVGGHPRLLGSLTPDVTACFYSMLAVLEALYYRNRTGRGQFIDISMADCMVTLIPEAVAAFTMNGRPPQRVGNQDQEKAPHDVFRCKGHDKWIAISVGTDPEWYNLCGALGRPELVNDPRFVDALSRQRHQGDMRPIIEAWTSEREHYDVMRLLQEAGVTAAPTLDAGEVMRDPHLMARGFIATVDHPEVGKLPNSTAPWKMNSVSSFPIRAAPLLGQHTKEVLQELLGLSDREVAHLTNTGAIR